MPPYTNEVEIRNALGIESWRHLSKDTFLQFLDSLPEVDPEVALKLIDQVPEITTLARGALDDAAKAYDAALMSDARGQPSLSTSGETLTIEESMNLEGENGACRTWRRARMELEQRLRLLPPAAKTSLA